MCCGQMYVLTIKVCAPHQYGQQEEGGGTIRGLGGGCSWKAGRLVL